MTVYNGTGGADTFGGLFVTFSGDTINAYGGDDAIEAYSVEDSTINLGSATTAGDELTVGSGGLIDSTIIGYSGRQEVTVDGITGSNVNLGSGQDYFYGFDVQNSIIDMSGDDDQVLLYTASDSFFNGGSGNDEFDILTNVSRTEFLGGYGNDSIQITGSFNNCYIDLGPGTDVLSVGSLSNLGLDSGTAIYGDAGDSLDIGGDVYAWQGQFNQTTTWINGAGQTLVTS